MNIVSCPFCRIGSFQLRGMVSLVPRLEKIVYLLNERLTSKPADFIALLLRVVYDGAILL